MYTKPECMVLYGNWGKKVYEDILNAKPLETPLYSVSESKAFENEFSKIIPEIIKEAQTEFEEM